MTKRKSLPAVPASNKSGVVQKLKGRMFVVSTNVTEITNFLQENHAKRAKTGIIKNENFYDTIYSECSIIVDSPDTTSVFLGQLHPDVLGSLRNLRIIVRDVTIWQHPNDVLHALKPIFACSPVRNMADIQLKARKAPSIVLPDDPFRPTKMRKYRSYLCFLVEGIVGLKVTLLVRQTMGQNLVTQEVMDWCLDQEIESPKVNIMHKLPPELREMVYAYVMPSGTEIIKFEGTIRNDYQCKDLRWQEYMNMVLACKAMSTEVISYVSRRCKFALQMETLDVDPLDIFEENNPTSFRHVFQAVVEMLPGWLLAQIGAVEMFIHVDDQPINIEDPLVPLLNDIRSNLRPKAATEAVRFTGTSDNECAALFSVHISAIPSLKIQLTFHTHPGSYLWVNSKWTPREKEIIKTILASLELNVRGHRSHVDLDYSTSDPVVDGLFEGNERYTVDEKGFLEADAGAG